MADQRPAPANEFCLLHTSPAPKIRRVKDIDIKTLEVGKEGKVQLCQVEGSAADVVVSGMRPFIENIDEDFNRALFTNGEGQDIYFFAEQKKLDLKTGKILETFEYELCTICRQNSPFIAHIRRNGDWTISEESCYLCTKTFECQSVVVRNKGVQVHSLKTNNTLGEWIQLDKKVLLHRMDATKFAFYKWADVLEGKFDPKILDISSFKPAGADWEADYIADSQGRLAVLWDKGFVKLPLMEKAGSLASPSVDYWAALKKVRKHRWVVCGGKKTTDPYTQVIKLVDSQLRIKGSLTYKLPDNLREHAAAFLTKVGSSTLLVAARARYLSVVQFSKSRLWVVKTNVDVLGAVDLQHFFVDAIDSSLGHFVLGADNGQLALIKVLFF